MEAFQAVKQLHKEAQSLIKEGLRIQRLQDEVARQQHEVEAKIKDFITRMTDAGITSLTLTDGSVLSLKQKHHCSINKNAEDKESVMKWLSEHGADHLIKGVLKVPIGNKEALEGMDIAFDEDVSAHTTSVKAWLIDQMGLNGGHQNITIDQLPKGLHFYTERYLEV